MDLPSPSPLMLLRLSSTYRHRCFHFGRIALPCFDLGRIALRCFHFGPIVPCFFDFGRIVLVISAQDCRCLGDSSDDQRFHRKDDNVQLIFQGRIVDDEKALDGFWFSPLKYTASTDPVSAPVTVSDDIAKLQSFLTAKRFASMHKDGDKLELIDARFDARHDTALGVWKKCRKVIGINSSTFPESGET